MMTLVTEDEADAQRRGPHGVGLGLRWAFLEEVVESGAPDAVRFFEVSPENYMRRGGWFPEALRAVADRHPLLSHGLMLDIGGDDPLDAGYLDTLREFLDELGLEAHSDHLCWSGVGGRTLHDLLPLPTRGDVIDHVVARVARARDRLRRPLALENISYYLDPDPRASIPEHLWVAEVIDRADCGLLLDVNNVWVNAQNHGLDPHEVLATMPLDRVAHLHVAGGERLSRFDDLVIDTHGTGVSEEVAGLMAWVVERTGPVPVIYERDHDIPPLAELGAQVAALNERYDAAVERWAARREDEALRAASRPRIDLTGPDDPSLGTLQGAMCRALLGPDEVPRAGAAGLESVPAARVGVYRQLVRNAMRATVRRFLPRTAARLGASNFDDWLSRWLDTEGPRSRLLRDLPHEFGAFVRERWRDEDTVPAWLAELAVHELLEMEVDAAPARAGGGTDAVAESGAAALGLDAIFVFDPSVRQVVYTHRIHELSADISDRSAPTPGRVALLAYRDANHEVRYLELTSFGEALIGHLRDGATLADAVRGAAGDLAVALDDALLVRAATLLADLGERGVVRIG